MWKNYLGFSLPLRRIILHPNWFHCQGALPFLVFMLSIPVLLFEQFLPTYIVVYNLQISVNYFGCHVSKILCWCFILLTLIYSCKLALKSDLFIPCTKLNRDLQNWKYWFYVFSSKSISLSSPLVVYVCYNCCFSGIKMELLADNKQ